MSTPVDAAQLFAAAVREEPIDLGLACALVALAADADVDVTAELAALDAFAALTRPLVAEADVRGQAEGLRLALGERAGFAGFADDYSDLRASLLPQVLRRRRGLPILLSVVWLEVARRVQVAAYPVALPGHVLVAVGSPEANVLVDPFHGGRLLTVHDAAERVRAAGLTFHASLLDPTPPSELLLRVLTNIRVLAQNDDDIRTRQWAVQLSLAVPGHPASLRRELGEILGRCGDFLGGAQELEAFADAVEPVEPAAAATARRNARMARSRLN